jgi:hypothetical protein
LPLSRQGFSRDSRAPLPEGRLYALRRGRRRCGAGCRGAPDVVGVCQVFRVWSACGAFHQRVSSGRDRFAPVRQRAPRQMCQQGCLAVTCMNRTRARFCPATRWCSRAVRPARGDNAPHHDSRRLPAPRNPPKALRSAGYPEMGTFITSCFRAGPDQVPACVLSCTRWRRRAAPQSRRSRSDSA